MIPELKLGQLKNSYPSKRSLIDSAIILSSCFSFMSSF